MYTKHKKHKSSKNSRQGDEQGWRWDDKKKDWYFLTVDENGTSQKIWAGQTQTTPSRHHETPKSQLSSVETITKGMQTLSHGAYDTQPDESYTTASGSRSKSKKGKEKQEESDEDSDDTARGDVSEKTRSKQESPEASTVQGSPQYTHSSKNAIYSNNPVAVSPAYQSSSYGGEPSYSAAYSTISTGATSIAYSYESPEVQAEMSKYTSETYSNPSYSRSAPTAYDYGTHPEKQERATAKAPENDSAFDLFDELDGDGKLDARYKVHSSSDFQPGSIFMVYWAEPKGSGKDDISSRRSVENKLGVRFYYGIRRFIVIANDQGHATVVPIFTYGRKGCKKKGVKPAKHGIVYQRGHSPHLLSGEPELGFPPVCAEITEEGERISKESRVNYSKLTSVEHNCRVLFIGYIVPDDFEIVQDAVNTCWEAMTHHRRRHRR
jgi:hypothetical protein